MPSSSDFRHLPTSLSLSVHHFFKLPTYILLHTKSTCLPPAVSHKPPSSFSAPPLNRHRSHLLRSRMQHRHRRAAPFTLHLYPIGRRLLYKRSVLVVVVCKDASVAARSLGLVEGRVAVGLGVGAEFGEGGAAVC